MIKHWKTIGLVVFVSIIFSLFYVQMSREVETYPTFTLETTEGNVEVVHPITLYGDFHTGEHTHLFSYNLQETMYVQQMPSLERLNGFYKYAEMERLEQLYPAYMRGKVDDVSMYTESDLYVVQADMDWGTYKNDEPVNMAFNLSVLHKELQKEARMTIEIPKRDQSSFISLEKMYAVGEDLHIVTSHSHDSDHGLTVFDLRVYTIQLDRGKIGSTDVIYTWEQEDFTEDIRVAPIENHDSILADQRMLLLKAIVEEDTDIENDLQISKNQTEKVSYELIAYDFRTKSLDTFKLPSQVKDGAEFISYEDNSDVFLIQENQEKLEVIEWQLGSDEQPGPLMVPTNNPVHSYTTSYQGEYLYIYVNSKAPNKNIGELHVLYVPTGEWVYAGDLMTNRPLKDEEEVIIHSIE